MVWPNSSSPAVGPLTQLTLVTFGPHTVVAEEFADLGADRVIIFGSWASRYNDEPGPVPGDIDVLVLGNELSRAALYAAAERAEARLGLPVIPFCGRQLVDGPCRRRTPRRDQVSPYVDVTSGRSE